MCRKLVIIYVLSSCGQAVIFLSESFGEEIMSLNGKQRVHNVVYLVFAAIDQGVDFCISWDAHSHRMVLVMPQDSFGREAVTYPVRC